MKKLLLAAIVGAAILTGYVIGRAHGQPAASSRRVLYYIDPMHPAYKSDKPGIAPDCGMQLEAVYDDNEDEIQSKRVSEAPTGSVRLNSEKQQLIGVQVVPVESGGGMRKIRALGRVAAEDTRIFRVTAGVQGWVQETFGDSVGSRVKKDQRLAAYYSPDFITFINGYLAATERGTTPMKEFVRGVQYSADRLRAVGVSESQIKEINATRQMPSSIDVVSPTDGIIVGRGISTGMRFERGAEFYQIADLSRVWIIAEVFENEAKYFRPGTVAHCILTGQKNTFDARVSDVLPEVDSATHTLKLRLEANNPGFDLRPDMFVDVELSASTPKGLTVPVDALIDSGKNKHVFVDRGNGLFEPRVVETGWQSGDRVQILKGLLPDEKVVASGTFLIDSESRMRALSDVTGGAPAYAPAPPISGGPKAMMVSQHTSIGNDTLARDPVCGMSVDPKKADEADNSYVYRGTKYHFCSRQDKEDFVKDPGRYLGHDMVSHKGGQP